MCIHVLCVCIYVSERQAGLDSSEEGRLSLGKCVWSGIKLQTCHYPSLAAL